MRALALSLLLVFVAVLPLRAEMVLLMAEEAGCMWCARFNAEVGDAYHKTAEGEAAPLRRIDLHDPLPGDVTLNRPLRFSPTFVLLVDGEEQDRIEGYPGEDFFYGILGTLLEKHSQEMEQG